jgi:hypothetical protein
MHMSFLTVKGTYFSPGTGAGTFSPGSGQGNLAFELHPVIMLAIAIKLMMDNMAVILFIESLIHFARRM